MSCLGTVGDPSRGVLWVWAGQQMGHQILTI